MHACIQCWERIFIGPITSSCLLQPHLNYIETTRFLFGEGNGSPLQYSCLENPMDGGAWYAAVHGVAKSRTRLSDFTFTFHFHALEKEMATHSRVLAWRIPGMGEPGGLPSMGSHRVRHNWSDSSSSSSRFYLYGGRCTQMHTSFLGKNTLLKHCPDQFLKENLEMLTI